MSDDHLVVAPEELKRLTALQPSDSDTTYAQIFAAVAKAIDLCDHDGQVTLLLSTCRNEYLTINAIFTDLKLCVSQRDGRPSYYEQFISGIKHDTATKPPTREAREKLGMLLSEARDKRKVWDNRETLWAEYEAASTGVPDIIGQRLAKSVLTSNQPIPHDDGSWPGQYTQMSTEHTKYHDKLELLAEITGGLYAVYEFLCKLADLEKSPTVEVSLFDEEVPAGPASVDWCTVIAAAEDRRVWYVSDGATGGVRLSHKNLPGIDQGWDEEAAVKSVELLSSTAPGDETREQLDRALGFAETGVAHARFLLKREFIANSARLPMPQPFVIDLTPREPLPRSATAPREFRRNITQVVEGDKRGDKAKIAVLRVAIPEAWHNHERCYRYNEEIADVAAITTLIRDAITAAATAGAKFLFLPECFIPRNAVKATKEAAARAKINLIGGLEAHLDDPGKTVNEALIWFPDASPDDHAASGLELFQLKQGPSIFEIGRATFAEDARLNVVKNTLLGNLGIVVCSDYLEADLIACLSVAEAPRLHALVVIARNPSQSVFTTLAQADAIRLYSHVIVVNSTDGSAKQLEPYADGGCIVTAPRGRGPLQEDDRMALTPLTGTPPGFQEPELLIWELDVAGIYARNNRGDQGGWLKASTFAKQA